MPFTAGLGAVLVLFAVRGCADLPQSRFRNLDSRAGLELGGAAHGDTSARFDTSVVFSGAQSLRIRYLNAAPFGSSIAQYRRWKARGSAVI